MHHPFSVIREPRPLNHSSEHETDYFENPSATTFGLTDRGRVRHSNQDQYLIAELTKSMLVSSTSLEFEQRIFGNVQGEILLVADGMGGHAAGETASRLAIGHLIRRLLNSVHWFFHGDVDKEEAFISDLQNLMKDAHARILLESERNLDQRGMGTTLTMAHRIGRRMFVVHAGDSRCYLIRDREVQQLTTDHTLARQMVESGGMKPEDEAGSRWSNVLWNVLGGHPDGDLVAEACRVDLQPGDVVVLCSDGLHRYVDMEALRRMVEEKDHPESICRRLVAHANDSGGEDNVTVVVSKPNLDDSPSASWIEEFDTSITDEPIGSIGPDDLDDKFDRPGSRPDR